MSSWREKLSDETGAALLSALLVMILMAAVTAGFTALLITDTRVRSMDGTRTQAFYAAQAGLEQLTSDLGDLFATNFAPTSAAINALTVAPPALGVTWQQPDGSSGYTITYPTNAMGNPDATTTTVNSGPFQGLVGLATPYQILVTARLPDGSEASLTRTLQTVAIPVFQFGLFSENDLSFFAGPNFNFGGRVHSNDTIYISSGSGSTLTMSDRVTAVGEIIRTNLSNGWDTSSNYTGPVRIITAPGSYRNLGMSEGSLVGAPGSAFNEPTWTNLSTGTYNSNLMNGRTGARRLELPITAFGATPIDLVRRPVPGEDTANPQVLQQRFFSMASVRILLSDTAAEITNLPTVTGTAPVALGAVAPYAVDGTHPPFGVVPSSGTSGARSPAGTPVMGGFIKIEKQDNAGVWTDVTLDILNLGIASRQWPDPSTSSPNCAEPNPDAVVRLLRLRDNNSCLNGSTTATNYLPQVLYDAREGNIRDGVNNSDPMFFGGIIHYVEVDVNNLRRWLEGTIGTQGTNALNVNGYVLYFSDRRGNHDAMGNETAEYGFEDIVNPSSASGTPNNTLDTGEDFNGNGTLETYGATPQLVAGMWAPLDNSARPYTNLDPTNSISETEEINIARRNPAIFFRRALKLTNGQLGNIITPGFTVATENMAYIQGHWNANSAGFGNPHSATAVLADSLTLLSNNWSDRRSLQDPHEANPRNATTTWYRLAIIAGKGLSFPRPTVGSPPQDFGTDGGAHNFLRYLEDWGGQTLNYRGSIVSFFRSRQGIGVYKCCADVYSPPTRGYNFDTEFLIPSLLPPRTPMFRDVNTTGFAQIIRPQ
ncbi:MAG: hypothetical protein R2752_15360 [Vicinamibacterales bacterium]